MGWFAGTVACEVTLFSTVEASTSTMIFFLFFLCSGLVDYGSVYGIIILRRKTWAWGLCAIPLATPILIAGVRVPSGATPDPS